MKGSFWDTIGVSWAPMKGCGEHRQFGEWGLIAGGSLEGSLRSQGVHGAGIQMQMSSQETFVCVSSLAKQRRAVSQGHEERARKVAG